MKAHPYSLLALILITLAFLFSGQAVAADIDATLPDSNNTSSFQVKNSENTNNVLMKVRSGGDVGIGTTTPEEKLDVNGNVQIRGTNGKLVFPSSHYDAKIELFKGGDEKIGTADNQLKLIAGSGTTDNIAFFGDSTEVMRIKTGSGNVGIGTTEPNSSLHINGSFSVKRTPVDTGTANSSGEIIIGITTSAACEITLLSDHCVEGRVIIIKDESGASRFSTDLITVTAENTTIDGESSQTISGTYGYIKVYSNGSKWFIIGRYNVGGV